jgi:hypothetical protein
MIEIGLVQDEQIVNVIAVESVAAARSGEPGFDAYLERKEGQSWGPGWAYSNGFALGPDGQAEEAAPAINAISLNNFLNRFPPQMIDAILDMEANPQDATGREVRRAMLRFRLSKNQEVELGSELLLQFVPMLVAFGMTQEQAVAAVS